MTHKRSIGDLMYNLMKIKDYYNSDFKKVDKKLSDFIKNLETKKSKKIKINLDEVEKQVKNYWKNIILEFVDELLNKINERKTRGSEFSQIKKDLEKTKNDLPHDDLDVETLRSYYEEDLNNYRDEIKEKLEIEKFNNKRFWQGIAIGFILGIIASFVVAKYMV